MQPQRKNLLAVAAAALLLAITACDSADDRTAATHESATSRTVPAANESRAPVREAARETRKETRQAAAGTDAAMERAARDTRAMGAAAAGASQTSGAVTRTIDDASITAQVSAALAGDKELRALRIDVDTRDGVVTLSGPAPTASAKERAAEVAHKVQGVESVNNQLTIKAS